MLLDKEGKTYVVDEVGTWIAFSNAVATLALGDGYVQPYGIVITVKNTPRQTLAGKTSLGKELAKALGKSIASRTIQLREWYTRLLLPTLPTPAFSKTIHLYDALTNYPMAAVVKVGRNMYILYHSARGGKFNVGFKRGLKFYKAIYQLGIKPRVKNGRIILTIRQLRELSSRGVLVKFFNELEKDAVREVKPASSPDLETLKKIMEEVAKKANIVVAVHCGREYTRIISPDKTTAVEILAMLKAAKIRATKPQKLKEIRIHERNTVEAIRKIMPQLFSHTVGFVLS